jgi:hypothetical protein
LEEQPHELVVVLQAVPRALPAQPAVAVHPQVFVEVLQLDPAGLAVQSAFVTQPTHRPVAVLQAGPDVLPAQSEFDVQAGSHEGVGPPLSPQVSPDGQSAFVLQPHVPMSDKGGNGPPMKHTLPPGEAAQLAAAVHPQVFVEVLQRGPAGLAAQSAFVTQPTHRPVALSHADPDVLPAQSELLVQAFEQCGVSPRHTWPPAQSAFVLQPHVDPPGSKAVPPLLNEPLHCLPPAAPAQSTIVEQPHVCGLPRMASLGLQTGPSALVAQSASELHATQAPVATSHTGPVALAEQSEFLLQRFSHCALFELYEKGDPCVGQTDPAGQLLVAVHPHLFSPVPALAFATWHTLPEREDAQSEAALHPHACVSVLQSGPSALDAQSALVLQPVDASTPPSPDGDVVLELLPHPHRASVQMIPATIPPASLTPFIELTPGGRVAARLHAADPSPAWPSNTVALLFSARHSLTTFALRAVPTVHVCRLSMVIPSERERAEAWQSASGVTCRRRDRRRSRRHPTPGAQLRA